MSPPSTGSTTGTTPPAATPPAADERTLDATLHRTDRGQAHPMAADRPGSTGATGTTGSEAEHGTGSAKHVTDSAEQATSFAASPAATASTPPADTPAPPADTPAPSADAPTPPAGTAASTDRHVAPHAAPSTVRARPTLRALPLDDPGVADLRGPFALLRWVAWGQRAALGLGVLWGILWMAAQATVPAVLGAGVQAAADREPRVVAAWALVVLALGIVQAAAGILRHRAAVTCWITAASRIQQLVARKASDIGADLPRQVATGEVVAVTATDVERIGSAFDVLARFAGAIVAFLGVAVVLVLASPFLGLIVLIGLPLLSLAILPLLRPLERRESATRAKAGEASALAADTVAGLRVLRGIGGEELFVQRFREASQEVRAASVRTARIRTMLDALQVALPGVFVVLVTWLGARLALDGRLGVGELVAFYGYTAFLVLPLRTITETADKWTRAMVASRRVVDVMSRERARQDPVEAASEPPTSARVADERSGVVAEPGALTGVVVADPDAAGALADRLGGYVVDDAVRLGDVRLADLPRDTLRRRILVQDSDPVILSGTLADLFDVPASGRVTPADAVAVAAAADVVEGLGGEPADPAATDAELPERGRTLSGGQRQRLALARSLVADPEVLVLDDPTSAVDAHTEARIAAALRDARRGRTTLVLTSSPLILEAADVVLFAPDGVVRARGTHRDLMHAEPDYRATVAREVD